MTSQSQDGLERVKVAPGRSVMGKIVIGYETVDGLTQVVLGDKTYGPGEELDVPVEDAAELRSGGFIIDPENPLQVFRHQRDKMPPGTPTTNGRQYSEMYHPV